MLEYCKYREYTIDLCYDLTLRCNLRCPYCYNLHKLDNKTSVNCEVFDKVIDQVNKLVNTHPEYNILFSLLGGEPLLLKDKVIEFIEKVDSSVTIFVNANLDYKVSHVNGLEKYPNVILNVSWHDSANQDRIKNNLLEYQGPMDVTIFITDENFDMMYDNSKWAAQHNIRYRVEPLRSMIDQEFLFTGFYSDRYNEMVANGKLAPPRQGFHMEDDIDLGLPPDKIRHVSKYYHTVCKIGQYSIMFDGEIRAACEYPFEDNIFNDDIDFTKSVYCRGYVCSCDAGSYKRLTAK